MKRTLMLSVAICILLSLFVPTTALATDEQVPSPCYLEVNIINANLSISGSGVASCYGKVILYQAGNTTNLTMTLQRKVNGSWNTVKTWSTSGTGTSLSLDKTKTVSSGYEYRVRVEARIYDSNGTLIESASKSSIAEY